VHLKLNRQAWVHHHHLRAGEGDQILIEVLCSQGIFQYILAKKGRIKGRENHPVLEVLGRQLGETRKFVQLRINRDQVDAEAANDWLIRGEERVDEIVDILVATFVLVALGQQGDDLRVGGILFERQFEESRGGGGLIERERLGHEAIVDGIGGVVLVGGLDLAPVLVECVERLQGVKGLSAWLPIVLIGGGIDQHQDILDGNSVQELKGQRQGICFTLLGLGLTEVHLEFYHFTLLRLTGSKLRRYLRGQTRRRTRKKDEEDRNDNEASHRGQTTGRRPKSETGGAEQLPAVCFTFAISWVKVAG
jgi:hypothetical protein